MDPSFIRGFRVDFRPQSQPIVFGLRLKPLTLGHLFVLESLRGEKQDLTDVSISVFVCAHDHKTAVRYLNAWWFPLFLWIWAKFSKPDWIEKDLETFQTYMTDGLHGPYLRSTGESGSRCISPGHWVRYEFALETLGLSREEALATPVAELNALYATWAERSGAATIGDYDAVNGLWEHVKKRGEMEAG